MITNFILGIAIVIGVYVIVKAIKYKSLYPFMPRRYNFGKRRVTFAKVLELLNNTKAKLIIETGTSRQGLRGAKGDGASTIVFGKWAKENKAKMHSVDINETSVNEARKEVMQQKLSDAVEVHLSDSLEFLKSVTEPVDFLYLDSYDYSADVEVQKKSQEHHLLEFKAIENQLHDQSIVLIDDCKLPNGGKGKTAIAYMKQNGWKVLLNKYQVLLVRQDFKI